MAAVQETEKVSEQPAEKAPEAPECPQYVMPMLDKGPAWFFETETKDFWVGIPVGKVDILAAWAVLDAVKMELLKRFQEEAVRRANQDKIVKPTWADKARQGTSNLLKKAGIIH